MTLDQWLVRLRMMARSSVVELSPTEVADLVWAIGTMGAAVATEREACAAIADAFNIGGMMRRARFSQERTGETIALMIRSRR